MSLDNLTRNGHPIDICGDWIHDTDNLQLIRKLNRVVSVLARQTEMLCIQIGQKKGELAGGAQGLTRSLNTVESCLEQIDILLEIRSNLRRQLAKLNNNLPSYADTLADNLLASFGA